MKSWKSFFVICLLMFLVPVNGYGETYNFYFAKPKKKSQKKKTPETVKPAEQNEKEEEEDIEVTSETSPAGAVPQSPTQPPVIINNTTTVAPSAAMSAPAEIETVVATQQRSSNVRFTLGAVYYPTKKIGPSVFDLDYQSNPGSNVSSYGGNLGLGFGTGTLAIMFFTGVHHSSSANKTLFQLGGDLEVYPFGDGTTGRANTLEFGGLIGLQSHLFTDGKFLSAHLGGRVNMNLSSSFGLTSVVRLGYDSLMVEAGIVTRL